jgi:serine/threonine-protein kinase
VGARPRSIAFGAGAVWVANEDDDNVTRIDASSGSEDYIDVGTGPTGIAYGGGAVWVANAGDGTVSRIDPTTEEVVEVIRVGNRPTGIAFGEGAVWVTVQAPTEE